MQKIVNLLLNYLVTYIIVPISWVVIDYFKMKKTIKQLNADIEKLKNAKTKSDIDSSYDSVP